MKLQYATTNQNPVPFMCPVCERPYRSGEIACEAYNARGTWIGRLCEECMVLADEVLEVRMPVRVTRGDGHTVKTDPATITRVDVADEVSCPICEQPFMGVVAMLQHYQHHEEAKAEKQRHHWYWRGR
jgi:hypothetical protein